MLTVSESGQGEDLNGDGDAEDDVLHIYDLTVDAATNLRLAGGPQVSGDRLVILVSEDAVENVVHLILLRSEYLGRHFLPTDIFPVSGYGL